MKPCSVWQREATLAFELRSCCLQNSLRAANDVVRVGVIDLQERWYLSQPIPVVGHTNKEGQRMWERERGRGQEGEGERRARARKRRRKIRLRLYFTSIPLGVPFQAYKRCTMLQEMYNDVQLQILQSVKHNVRLQFHLCLYIQLRILECMDHFPLCWSCSTALISQAVEHTVFVHGSQNKARNDNIPYASGVCICSIPMFWTRPHTKRK